MARPRNKGRRTKSGRLSVSAEALAERNPPADRVLQRRAAFARFSNARKTLFVTDKDGGLKPVDQTCDGIGQLWLLGFLDGHGIDPDELLEKGRFWGTHYASLLTYGGQGASVAGYERSDKGRSEPRESAADRAFDRMMDGLGEDELDVLIALLVDPIIGCTPNATEVVPWVQSLVHFRLFKEADVVVSRMKFPGTHEEAMLATAIRGLCQLVDGALEPRWTGMRSAA